ncbi:MAG TPA: DUF1868 domain-containing protein [Candidatus Obscuribacterales bacterium]
MDETYQTYLNRVARLTLPATYQSQVQHIQDSPKFAPHPSGGRKAVPFPGYTVITPPWEEEAENSALYENLKACQEQLLQQLDTDLMVPVPADSFHLTLADLIWDGAYSDAVRGNPDFDVQLRDRIAESFEQCKTSVTGGNPIHWQLLGLIIMPRAVGVCLLPKHENFYERILQLRRSIYQNPGLIALGIEQQYHFTAHITLGYFGDIPPELYRDRLSATLSQLNDQWLDAPQELWIRRAELRKFDDMTRYYREPDWPVLEF